MKKAENVIVALDIGTTKISVIVAEYNDNSQINILGVSKISSQGIFRGIINDVSLAVNSIKIALKEAELMSGYTIDSVYIGISGTHIQSQVSDGMVPIKHGKIRTEDIAAVLNTARALSLPEGQKILHVLPSYYMVDSNQKIKDPTGMYGIRLEVRAQIITGSIAAVQNIINACELAGVSVRDIILEPLASAYAVLSNDEKELGIGLLDIGGGTSDFAIYQNGMINYTHIFGIAGNHITQDIALCLRTSLKDAERAKKVYGSCNHFNNKNKLVDKIDEFEVEMVQGVELQLVQIEDLINIIESRVNELLEMVVQKINYSNLLPFMPAGIVLTGGGSLLEGIKENAEKILNIPVRLGKTNVPDQYKDSLSSPIYATGYGILIYVLNKKSDRALGTLSGPLVSRIVYRMKSWILDFF